MDSFSLDSLLLESSKGKLFYETITTVGEIIANPENTEDTKLKIMDGVKKVLAHGFMQYSYRKFVQDYGVYCVGDDFSFGGLFYSSLCGINDEQEFIENLNDRLKDLKNYAVENSKSVKFKEIEISLKALSDLGVLEFLQRNGVELHLIMCKAAHTLRDSESEIRLLADGGMVDTITIYNNIRGGKHQQTRNTAYLFVHEVGHLIHTLLCDGDTVPDSFIQMLEKLGANFGQINTENITDLFSDILANSTLIGTKCYIETAKTKEQADLDNKLADAFRLYFKELMTEGDNTDVPNDKKE